MVKAVESISWLSLWSTINGMFNLSKSSPFIPTQTIPVPCFTMKAIVSFVTASAAIIRSPSFSLSSSSTTTTIYKQKQRKKNTNPATMSHIATHKDDDQRLIYDINNHSHLSCLNIFNRFLNGWKPFRWTVQIGLVNRNWLAIDAEDDIVGDGDIDIDIRIKRSDSTVLDGAVGS